MSDTRLATVLRHFESEASAADELILAGADTLCTRYDVPQRRRYEIERDTYRYVLKCIAEAQPQDTGDTDSLAAKWFFSDEGVRLMAEALNGDGGPNHRPIVDSYGRAKIGAWRIALTLAAAFPEPEPPKDSHTEGGERA